MVRKTKIWWKSKTGLYGYSFIACIKIDVIYRDIAEDVEPRFDTSNDDELECNSIGTSLLKGM